jgi:hypothetical protein
VNNKLASSQRETVAEPELDAALFPEPADPERLERRMARLRVAALGELIRIHARRNRVETAATLLLRLESALKSAPGAAASAFGDLLQLQLALASAYVALARRNWRSLGEALARAAALAERTRRGREAVEIKLLEAYRLRSTGASGEAVMREALSLAEAHGLRRLVADVYPSIAEWAPDLRLRCRALRRLLHARRAPGPWRGPQRRRAYRRARC